MGNLMLAGGQSCYQIKNSLMLDSGQTQYLTRTTSAVDESRKWTVSCWFKRGKLAQLQALFGAIFLGGNNNIVFCGIDANDKLWFRATDSVGVIRYDAITTAAFRDTTSWYHLVVQFDTTAPTPGVKLFINDVQISSFSTLSNSLIQNTSYAWGYSGNSNVVGAYYTTANAIASPFDGYLAEFISATNLLVDPSAFGRACPISGEWEPKKYKGTYGTNGFCLEFKNGASLGTDTSGNGNNWTLNGGIVAANQYIDTPTNNFPVLNGLETHSGNGAALSAGALVATGTISGALQKFAIGTLFASAPLKFFFEGTPKDLAANTSSYIGVFSNCYYAPTGQVKISSWNAYGAAYNTGDVIGVACDTVAGTVEFFKNGVSQGVVAGAVPSPTTATGYCASSNPSLVPSWSLNFGQRPFSYTPPAGYKALCTNNLPIPSIIRPNRHFGTKLYTGNGASQNIAGLKFSPGLVWIKGRSGATDHALYDTVRGATKDFASNLGAAETTQVQGLTAFNSDGFSIGSLAKLNTNAATYAAWCWRKGVTPGFDIVPYTGNGTNRTIAHALGQIPALIIIKNRNNGAGTNWTVWHKALAATEYLLLNSTDAKGSSAAMWNSALPTSSVFSLGTDVNVNAVYDHIAYLFAEVTGFSKFGTYTGNGSTDGPFAYCGFKPAFVMLKRVDAVTSGWFVWDDVRNTNNPTNIELYPNLPNAEVPAIGIDTLANGIKIRTAAADYNASGGTYIFAAFAEIPTKYALAR